MVSLAFNHFIYSELVSSANYVSGLMVDNEAADQTLDDGTGLIEAIRKRGFIPGVVVDKGVTTLKGQPGEYITEGLVALTERCEKFKERGCNFAKWRSVFPVQNVPISTRGLRDNAKVIARVALKCQDTGLVPIVEIDVMPIGEHNIIRTQKVFEAISSEVFKALQDHHVFLEGMILRASFITPGQHSPERATPWEIARATLNALRRTVPPAVPAIAFRGGGKSEEEATVLLNELNKHPGRKPWHLTFAFGRSLQISAIKAWNGEDENMAKAQQELLQRAKANSEASLGKYVIGSVTGAASDFMMIIKDPYSY